MLFRLDVFHTVYFGSGTNVEKLKIAYSVRFPENIFDFQQPEHLPIGEISFANNLALMAHSLKDM